MVPREDLAEELGELALDGVFGGDDGFLCAGLFLVVEVVLTDERGEARDIRVGPGGFALEEVVHFALGFGALGGGFFVGEFGFFCGLTGDVNLFLWRVNVMLVGGYR